MRGGVIKSNNRIYIVGSGLSDNEVTSTVQIRLNIDQLRYDRLFEARRLSLIERLKILKLSDGYAWIFRQFMRHVPATIIEIQST